MDSTGFEPTLIITIMAKGLDGQFLNYGVRKGDLDVIRVLAQKHKLIDDWVIEEVLKGYHEVKNKELDVDDTSVEKVIEKALKKI
jgi:hypothetical protein